MTVADTLKALENTKVAEFVQVNDFAFPVLEATHVVAIMLVVGSVAMLDLRLLGVSSRSHAVTKLTGEVLPWTWVAFVVAVITGGLLFTAQASSYFINVQFRVKMLLMVLAGLNMVVFHFVTWRSVHDWNSAKPTPALAKAAGGLSLLFWIGVVVFGRWVGWTVGGG